MRSPLGKSRRMLRRVSGMGPGAPKKGGTENTAN
jgi:hypothetical protein